MAITVKNAIRVLQRLCFKITDPEKQQGLIVYNDAFDLSIHALEQSIWHGVDESPSKKVGDDGYRGYLLIVDHLYYAIGDYTTDKYNTVPCFHVDGEYEPDVTAWMELPEQPELMKEKS